MISIARCFQRPKNWRLKALNNQRRLPLPPIEPGVLHIGTDRVLLSVHRHITMGAIRLCCITSCDPARCCMHPSTVPAPTAAHGQPYMAFLTGAGVSHHVIHCKRRPGTAPTALSRNGNRITGIVPIAMKGKTATRFSRISDLLIEVHLLTSGRWTRLSNRPVEQRSHNHTSTSDVGQDAAVPWRRHANGRTAMRRFTY
jgi:hypothetical protein